MGVGTYIYRGRPLKTLEQEATPGAGGQTAWGGGGSNRQGRRCRETLATTRGDIPNGPGQASRKRWSRTHVPIIQHISWREERMTAWRERRRWLGEAHAWRGATRWHGEQKR
jgi:hypothetical protein